MKETSPVVMDNETDDHPDLGGESELNQDPITNPNLDRPTHKDTIVDERAEEVTGFRQDYDDISPERTGNFLFTVGNVSAGKSTIQASILYYLFKSPHIDFQYIDKYENPDHDVWVNNWNENYDRGYLPRRSAALVTREFNFRVSSASNKSLLFGLLEISGENISSIVPRSGVAPKLHENIEKYLTARVKKRFLFVSDASKNVRDKNGLSEDILFSTLLRYLISKDGLNLKKVHAMFLAAKWDTVAHQYGNSEAKYFELNFPQTLALINSTNLIHEEYMPFSVGLVETVPDPQNTSDMIAKIKVKDDSYSHYLISWLYSSFTGDQLSGFPKLRPTIWQRLLSFLS